MVGRDPRRRAVALHRSVKQTLQLKLSQHLTLTPQLQQSIRLLQLSTVELNAEVERMLQENPLLEKVELPRCRMPRCRIACGIGLQRQVPAQDREGAVVAGEVEVS